MTTTQNHVWINDFLRFQESALKNLPARNEIETNEMAYRIGKNIGAKMGARLLCDDPPFEEMQRRTLQIFNDVPHRPENEIHVSIYQDGIKRFALSINPSPTVDGDGERGVSVSYFSNAGLLTGLLQYYFRREKLTIEISNGERDIELRA